MKPLSLTKNVLFIFVLAFAARLAYTFFLSQNYFFYNHPGSDVLYYRDWAMEIASGDWLGGRVFFGMPLYPYILSVLLRISLANIEVVRIFHLLIGSLNCVLVYQIARKMFTENIGILAGLFCAFSFTLIYYDWLMMPVPFIILFSLLIVYLHITQNKNFTQRQWFVWGLLLGLSCLLDGKFLIFIGIYLLWNLTKKRIKQNIPVVIGVLCVLLCVGLRNYLVGKSWVWITAQTGLSFYVGNGPNANGLYQHPNFLRPDHHGQDADQIIEAQRRSGKNLTAKEVSHYWRAQALQHIQENPNQYPQLLGEKITKFFTEIEEAYDVDLLLQKQWKSILDWNPYWLVWPFAVFGMFITRKKEGSTVINIVILSQLIFTLIFFLNHRHRATLMPFLIMYEVVFFAWLLDKIKSKKFIPVAGTLLGALACVFIFPYQNIDAKTYQFLYHTKTAPIHDQNKNFLEAEKSYRIALQLEPTDTNVWYNLANSQYQRGNLEAAIQTNRHVLTLNPQHIDALFNLGFIYKERAQWDLAIEYFVQVIQLSDESIDAHFQLAEIYRSTQNCAMANKHYMRVQRYQPQLTKDLDKLRAQCVSP